MSAADVCLSGGAEGADLVFGTLAATAGHKVVHYGFEGMKSKVPLHILDKEQLQQASVHVHQAASFLQRQPPRRGYVTKLIQRNFFQVNTATSIYAVTRWNLIDAESKITQEGNLGGGTGWAVAMAIALQVPNVYLFAIERAQWYRYSYEPETKGWQRIEPGSVPPPSGRYAGIGSRDLGEVGQKAISDLYMKEVEVSNQT